MVVGSLAAALGCSPEHLLDVDLDLFHATANAVAARERAAAWDAATEMAAQVVDRVTELLAVTVQVNGGGQVEAVRVPRPEWIEQDDGESLSEAVSHADMALMMGG